MALRKPTLWLVGVLAALAGALVASPAASASGTISVECDHQALQPKIAHAAPGSILLLTGTCHGNFTVGKDLTLRGNPSATLNGDQSGTTLTIASNHAIRLRSLVITGGKAPRGGGIDMPNGGTLTLNSVTVQGNLALGDGVAKGGGIYAQGTATIRQSSVVGNHVTAEGTGQQDAEGAGIFWEDGSLTVENSVVRGNKAAGQSSADQGEADAGGIFSINTSLLITSSVVRGNQATALGPTNAFVDGGGVFFRRTSSSQDLAITGSQFLSNSGAASTSGSVTPIADAVGGGLDIVFLTQQGNPFAVTGSTFQGNKVRAESDSGRVFAAGGGIYFNSEGQAGPAFRLDSSQVLDSQVIATGATTAEGDGGGLDGLGRIAIGRSDLSGNTITVHSGTDAATAEGGGIDAPQLGAVNVSATTIDSNAVSSQSDSGAAGAGGGGMGTNGTATLVLRASTVSHNQANTTAQTNSSEALGGGLDLESSAAHDQIVNSTIVGNQLAASGQSSPDSLGGGIEAVDASLVLQFVTLLENGATASGTTPFGGGGNIDVEQGTTTLEGTILALGGVTTNGPNCLGTVHSDGFNLFGTLAGCTLTPQSTDLQNTAPSLGSLADNGGPTKTLALLKGSNGLDLIPTTDCHAMATKDQRFVARPQGPECDVGAFERNA